MGPARLILLMLVSCLGNAQEPIHPDNTIMLQNLTTSSESPAGTIVFGTLWHVYIHTTLYHLLATDVHESGGELTFFRKSLIAFASEIPHLTMNVNPCKKEQTFIGSLGMGNIPGLLSDVATRRDSRWCGTVHVTFRPRFAENIYVTRASAFECRWLLHANTAFRFNITFLSYEVFTFFQRSSLKLHVVEPGINISWAVANEYKPGFLQLSYYSATNTINVVLSTKNFNLVGATLSSADEESHEAKFAFQYQIHDNDFSFVRLRDVSYNHRPFAGLQSSSAGISTNVELYQIRIHAPWLKTVVLDWAKFICRNTEAKIRIIFYDQPELELSKAIYRADHLAEWQCPKNPHNGRRDNVEATIGDLTAWILAEKGAALLSTKDISLHYRYIDLSGSVSTIENITLQTMGRRTAFIPASSGKHVHLIQVKANRFLRISFQKLSYQGYTSHECRLGGMMLISRHHLKDRICSNLTGEYLTEHFYSQGIAVGRTLVVITKQYGWLSQVTANITLELGLCSGFVNALPYFIQQNKDGGILYGEMGDTWPENEKPHSFYYRLSTMNNHSFYFLQFYRERNLCYTFQIVFFDIFGFFGASVYA